MSKSPDFFAPGGLDGPPAPESPPSFAERAGTVLGYVVVGGLLFSIGALMIIGTLWLVVWLLANFPAVS